jgi:hypothetical protein
MQGNNVLEYTKKQLDEFRGRLVLKIYREFVYNQREQAMWDAGFETIDKIGRETKQ